MEESTAPSRPPLEHWSESELRQQLRGFSEETIANGLALRAGHDPALLPSFLFGILCFFLPAGTSPPETLPSDDTRLREELGLDSLSMAEAMFKIEELFDIRIENAELAEVSTLDDARCLLMEKLSAPRPASPDA